jgi:hypothetical protein
MNGSVADRCILTQQAGYNILNVRVEGRWQSKLPFDDLVTRFPFFVRHVQRGQVIAGGQLRKAVATFLFVSQPLPRELKTPMPVSEAIRGISRVSAVERRRSRADPFLRCSKMKPGSSSSLIHGGYPGRKNRPRMTTASINVCQAFKYITSMESLNYCL